MTKTLKKGLIAVLMFLMAVVLGLGAYTSLSVARAAEADHPAYVERFEGYLDTFIEWAKEYDEENYMDYLTEEYLLAEGNDTLWSAYGLPKRLYSNNMTNADREAVGAEYKTVWSALEDVFSTTYTYASRANSTMESVSEAKWYSGNIERLEALEKEIGTLMNYELDAEGEAYLLDDGSVHFTEGQMRYLAFATDNFDFMSRAKRNMDAIWEGIQAAINSIKSIDSYDTTTKRMMNSHYTGARTQRIVLDSEKSLDEAKAALDEIHPNDIKYVENLDLYERAKDMLQAQYDLAAEVQDMIDAVYAKFEEGTTYYSLKAEIEAARKAYADLANDKNAAWKLGLKGGTNHNDLQSLVDELKLEMLEEMEAKIAEIEEQIQAVIDAIAAIGYYDGETMKYDGYTGEQRIVLDSEESFEAVEAELAKLHDLDDGLDEYVTNLDLYEKAKAEVQDQYDLAQSVQDLIDEVKELVEAEGYYTNKDKVQEARDAYDALANDINAAWEGGLDGDKEINYNDLQKLVENFDVLEEMEAKIAEIEEQIQGVIDAIEQIPNKGDEDYEYSEEFEEAVKNAEELFEALPDDVKENDMGNYPNGDYIVDDENGNDYGKLVDSRKQYNKWNEVVDDLLKLVEELIETDTLEEGDEGFEDKGRDLVDKYNEIQEKYQDGLSTEEGGELTPKQLDKFENSEFDFRGKEDEKVKEILKRIRNTILDKQAAVGVVDGDIHDLYAKTILIDECVYEYIDDLKEIKAEYDALEAEVKSYSTYVSELEKMWAEYLAENLLVNAWLETLDAMEVPACVLTWEAIDVAEAAWLALVHKNVTVTGDILSLDETATLEELLEVVEFEDEELTDGLGKLQAIVAKMYATEYADYAAAIKSRNELKAKIDEVVAAMADLDTTPQPIEAIPAWVKTVEAVMGLVEELEAMDEHALGWIIENEQEAYENYERALDMYDAYKVVQLIEDIYEGNPDDAEDKIGLEHAGKIDEAREAYNEYIEKHPEGDNGDIENLDKLEAAEAALAKLTEELNAWMIRVIRLYNPEFSAESTREEILEELKKAAEFLGYPLNISEDSSKYPEDGLAAVREAYDELVTPGSLEAEYVEAAWKVVAPDATLEQLSDAAIAELAEDIKAINDKFYITDEEGNYVLNGQMPDKDDLKAIEWINERREELFHPSQLEELEELLKAYDDLLASLDVPESFFNMVEELYNEAVVNGNVTNYTPYYLEILKTIFEGFNPAVQAMFTVTIGEGEEAITLTFDEVVNAIEQAIADARDEEGNLPSLNGAFDKIEELRKALEAANNANDKKLADDLAKAVADLEEKIAAAQKEVEGKLAKAIEDLKGADKTLTEKIEAAQAELDQAKADLNTAIENAKSELNDAIENAKSELNDAIEQAKEDLQNNIDDLESKVEELVDAEQVAREAGDKKLADDLAAAIKDLNKAIEQAKTELNETLEKAKSALEAEDARLDKMIESVSTALEDAKTDLNKAIADAKAELNKEIEDLESKLNKKIEEAQSELQGNIEELQSALDNFKKTEQAAREAGDKKLADDLAAAIKDLEKKIADAQSTLTSTFETAKGELEAADKKLDEKINDVSTALDTAKADLNKAIADAKAELNKAIADLKTELEGEIKKAKDDLQKTIDELDKKLSGLIGETSVADQIAAAKAEIEKAITDALEAAFNFDNIEINDLSASLAAAFEDYNNKITAAYTAAIDKAVSELEAKLTGFEGDYAKDLADIQSKIDAINSALATVDGTLDSLDAAIKSVASELATVKADLEAAIAKLREDMEKADADLQDQIDAINSKISTIFILVIVLAVVLVAAVVCIIILFAKRNKANA